MKNRRYFHIFSDGFVEEISQAEYIRIVTKERDWAARKLVASVYGDEINLVKGNNHIFLQKEWLKKILEAPPK